MPFLIIGIIAFLGIILGKYLFNYWFNHLSLYCAIWGGGIIFYEMKLLPYVELIPEAWYIIGGGFLAFLLGIFTIISSRSIFQNDSKSVNQSNFEIKIMKDNGKILKYTIFLLSTLSLLSAIQNWYVLIKMFGNIPNALIHANLIYRLNVNREIHGVIPYVSALGYVAVFFAGIYSAYKGKFTLLSVYPIIGIVIKELAEVGRAGILLSFIEFFASFFLFRQVLKRIDADKYKFSRRNAIIASTFILALFVLSASFIKIVRGSYESYIGASRKLNKLEGNAIISPSIYLYMSSDVGVLSKFLYEGTETAMFGENTFLPVYSVLSKFEVLKRPSDYQRGYFIPMWTNTGTYLRELYADFGPIGVFLGPYLIGLLTTWFWFKFYERKNLLTFLFLVFFYIIVGYSFIVMVTRLSYWFISLVLLFFFIPVIEKLSEINSKFVLPK